MKFRKLRELIFTMEGMRKRWERMIGDKMRNKSEEEQARVYELLENATKFTRGRLKGMAMVGFVESVFLIYMKTKCGEPEIIYEMFSVLVAGDPPQLLTDMFESIITDAENANAYDFLVGIFVDAYCGSTIALKRHPSYKPHIDGNRLVGYN